MVLATVIIYMVLMLLIGLWCNRRYIKGMTDFLLAGRRLGVWLCAATLAATHFGGGAVMGGGEYGFQHGVSGAWYGVSCGVGLLFLGFMTARRFRDLALYTVPDYLEQRYGGRAVRVLGALLSLIALIGILAAQVLSARSALGIVGVKGNTGAVLATLVFIVYTATGGLWAATATDFVQLMVAGVGVIIGGIVVLAKASDVGGLAAALSARGVEPRYFSFFGMDASAIMWLLIPTVMYTLVGQDFYQRLFAAKDSKVARNASLLGGVVLIIVSFFPAIMGMGARALSDLREAGLAVPWVLQSLVNPVLGGIILAAVLAAIMSTADSLLTAATSHVVKDLWVETFRADEIRDEAKLLKISRVWTLVIGVLSLVVALLVPGIIDALIYSYTMYTAGVFIPVIGGLLWKSATREGALVSLVGGSLVALWGILTKASVFGVPVEIYSAVISLLIFVLVSLATQKRAQQVHV